MKKSKGNNKNNIKLIVDDVVYNTQVNKAFLKRKPYEPLNPKQVTSFMPGNIQEVFVEEGTRVTEGEKLCILEAMKMKNIIMAPMDGVVKKMNVKVGDKVPKNYVLAELK